VEGIAEALLCPVLARMLGVDLKTSAVSVINADGINFNAFLPLFGKDGIKVPVALMSDKDANAIGGGASDSWKKLKCAEADCTNLKVVGPDITFEHELARSSLLLPFMIDAFKNLMPIIGSQLEADLAEITNQDKKADLFYNVFLEKKLSKGRFAQELAYVLDDSGLSASAVPPCIREAMVFLGLTGATKENEQAGGTEETDPVPEAD
jgi:putative ATP-dependent endonuclease of OLD family